MNAAGGRLLAPLRWLLDVKPPPAELPAPDPGPLVLELEPVYGNGATGALVRLELAELDEARVPVPAGAAALRVRVVHRAGIYAGETTSVDVESLPPPAFFRGIKRP